MGRRQGGCQIQHNWKPFLSSSRQRLTASCNYAFSVWFLESMVINGNHDIYISKQSVSKRKNLSPPRYFLRSVAWCFYNYCALSLHLLFCVIDCFLSSHMYIHIHIYTHIYIYTYVYAPSCTEVKFIGVFPLFPFLHVFSSGLVPIAMNIL